jgi:hypothetical protein
MADVRNGYDFQAGDRFLQALLHRGRHRWRSGRRGSIPTTRASVEMSGTFAPAGRQRIFRTLRDLAVDYNLRGREAA